MKLFVITQLSELLIEEALRYPDSIFITPDQNIAQQLNSECGIQCQLLPLFHSHGHHMSTIERDEAFANDALPGNLKDLRFPQNEMPLWKSLSIDRYRFWYTPSELPDLINQFNYDELVISADIYHNLPWAVATAAHARDVHIKGIKTHTLRTREFASFYPYSLLNKIVVSFNDEKEYLNSLWPNDKINVTAIGGERSPRKPIDSQKRDALRSGLQIPNSAYLTGLIYDKRDEWQFRVLMSRLLQNELSINAIVFPYDGRSLELFPKCMPDAITQLLNPRIIDDQKMLAMCDEVVMFRFLEDIYTHMADIPLIIYDFHNLNMAHVVAIPGIEVLR